MLVGIISTLVFAHHLGPLTDNQDIQAAVVMICMILIERARQGNQALKPAMFTFVVTLIIGVLDEGIQIFLPSRVFDPLDMLFNSLAAFMAIGASMAILWARKKIG